MVTKFFKNFRLTAFKNYNIKNTFQNRTIAVMNKGSQKQPRPKAAAASQVLNYTPISNNVQFEVLQSPTKSFSDKKEYKVIRLQNGLTACIICDTEKCKDVASVLSEESDAETDNDSETDGSEDGTGTESEAESVKSVSGEEKEDDDAKIKRTDKKSQDEVKLAAAALCIGVGSFSDPKEVPGLAHFLEHMVFMGSEKFPQENDFDAFIKKHGGSDNASTDYETTTFYFECFEKHLYQAMDKFAQFFISPLMKRESMTREREAVESEFQMAVPSDDYRKEQLLVSLCEECSPVNSFSWGSLKTLKDNISDDKLYEMLHEFRKRHYSAHRMTLAVQARLPLDMLESYVVNCFSEVPNNSLPSINFKLYSEKIFNTPQFKRLYYVKPVKDICQVDLTWVMPSLQHMYKSKPHVYVSWLLGHEGKGSLLSYLKKKVWALSLYAGNGESGAEFNSIYASFSVNIVLTKEGFIHLDEVIQAVFSYLKLLKLLGPSERIFKEIQSIEEQSFRFEEDESASDKVEELVENMHFYPPEDYLTGSELFFEYNPEAINMVFDHLVPDKMNILVMSSTVPDHTVYDKVEPWFKTQYADKDIPESWMKKWLSAEPVLEFALPEPNPFLTEDFNLLPNENNIPEYPQKIMQGSLVELWYRKDQKFGLPMAYYYYYLITPLALESAESACMMQMLVAFVIINLAEEGYPAQIAELSYSLAPCEKGVCLKISGYNEKLPMLIALIVKYLKTASTSLTVDIFEAIKEKQTKNLYNGFLKPSKLCKDVRLSILQNKYFSLLDRHAAMSKITFDAMKQFSQDILGNLYIQGLVQGNVTKQTALETTQKFLDELKCVALPTNKRPEITINEIPLGEHCCRVTSFNKTNSNSIITNYYQCGPVTIKDSVILEFIMLLIEEPLFDVLRTKEQLGYSVYCTIRDTYGILGYSVTVNAQAGKHTTEHVDSRIEVFLKHSQKTLKKMSEKKFMQTKKDLIKVKKFVDVDLEDEVDRNWEEIVNCKNMFDRVKREIEAIENLKIGEVRKWWDRHNIYSKKDSFKKLSVQVVGHVVPGSENAVIPSSDAIVVDSNVIKDVQLTTEPVVDNKITEDMEKVQEKDYKLEFIEDIEEITNKNRETNYFITNIGSFKKNLKIYPSSPKKGK
ncbi:hypothetical protein ILUMI_20515 [Ignelater luminosus]|uniref:Nardilysin n=1 Tax=Ignelater luminosus TaxID=2038154 RepID=A0A8K0CG91_IGNLU|nr:hypothetical protein ILUMI_20515 [Ignelater luminosus]